MQAVKQNSNSRAQHERINRRTAHDDLSARRRVEFSTLNFAVTLTLKIRDFHSRKTSTFPTSLSRKKGVELPATRSKRV